MDISQNCSVHDVRTAGWYCWNCGLPFCEECIQPWNDQYLCNTCLEDVETGEPDDVTQPSWPNRHREANLITRLLAFFIDFTLVTVGTIGLTWLLHHLLELNQIQTQYLYWIIFYGGIVFRDGLLPGGSPGKRAVGIYVWNLDLDRPISGLDSIRRNLVLIVFFFDVLVLPFTRERQRVGDLLAGTKVCEFSPPRSILKKFVSLAGVVILNLALLFGTYLYWLNSQSSSMSNLDKILGDRTVTSENIVSVLREVGQGIETFHVVRRPDGLYIEAETSSADRYYRTRRRIEQILGEASYEISSEDNPELVFRGQGDVRFLLRIKATQGKE